MTINHFKNFVNGIRHGEKLHSPVEDGNISVTILQLSNIAWKVGRNLNLDSQNGHVLGDDEAAKMCTREYEPGWELKI